MKASPDLSNVRYADRDLATKVLNAVNCMTTIPDGAVKATVQNGWLTLHGAVQNGHQRNTIEEAVRTLTGLKGVTNLIIVR